MDLGPLAERNLECLFPSGEARSDWVKATAATFCWLTPVYEVNFLLNSSDRFAHWRNTR